MSDDSACCVYIVQELFVKWTGLRLLRRLRLLLRCLFLGRLPWVLGRRHPGLPGVAFVCCVCLGDLVGGVAFVCCVCLDGLAGGAAFVCCVCLDGLAGHRGVALACLVCLAGLLFVVGSVGGCGRRLLCLSFCLARRFCLGLALDRAHTYMMRICLCSIINDFLN